MRGVGEDELRNGQEAVLEGLAPWVKNHGAATRRGWFDWVRHGCNESERKREMKMMPITERERERSENQRSRVMMMMDWREARVALRCGSPCGGAVTWLGVVGFG